MPGRKPMMPAKSLGVVVTGGAGDIGTAIGIHLAQVGSKVTLIDRKSRTEAEPWLSRARRAGEVNYAQADVQDRGALRAVLTAIDPLDISIGNAGVVAS